MEFRVLVFRSSGFWGFSIKKVDFGGIQWVKKHWKFQDPFHFPRDPFHGLGICFFLQGIHFHDRYWTDPTYKVAPGNTGFWAYLGLKTN
jgi:hypothetical protein